MFVYVRTGPLLILFFCLFFFLTCSERVRFSAVGAGRQICAISVSAAIQAAACAVVKMHHFVIGLSTKIERSLVAIVFVAPSRFDDTTPAIYFSTCSIFSRSCQITRVRILFFFLFYVYLCDNLSTMKPQ